MSADLPYDAAATAALGTAKSGMATSSDFFLVPSAYSNPKLDDTIVWTIGSADGNKRLQFDAAAAVGVDSLSTETRSAKKDAGHLSL